jgi:hypothetical protein
MPRDMQESFEHGEPTKEFPSLETIRSLISDFEQGRDYFQGETFARSLSFSHRTRFVTDDGQHVNSLSGKCNRWSNTLYNYLREKGVQSKLESSKMDAAHKFLSIETDSGKIYIDPTLGQFIDYQDVFVGTMQELKDIFLDPNRQFFMGKKLFAVDHDILTREEWFDILYTI